MDVLINKVYIGTVDVLQIFFIKKQVPRSEIIPYSQYVEEYETGTTFLRTFKTFVTTWLSLMLARY